jgi:hypothetical protein
MLKGLFGRLGVAGGVLAVALSVSASGPLAAAQGRLPDLGRIGESVGVQMKVGEITLESIDFRDQTARLSVGLDIANGFVPVSLKDFDYALRLADRDVIEGTYYGKLKIGGRRASRVQLPLTVNLRSIPGVVWSAFSNRGRVRYDLDAAFTVPLFITERRFDQSLSGEVPLRTLVDAASILRARRMGEGGGSRASDVLNRLPLPW